MKEKMKMMIRSLLFIFYDEEILDAKNNTNAKTNSNEQMLFRFSMSQGLA
jgi:hypothetical protein